MMWISRRRECALSTCNEAVYKDHRTGQEHDFCGKTHAILYKQQQASLQHQRAATLRPADRATGGNRLGSKLRTGSAVKNQHHSNPSPSGPLTSGGGHHHHRPTAANGAFPPAAQQVQQTLPTTLHTPTTRHQALRVTDTMVLFWNPPCVFTQWEPANFTVEGVSSDAEYRPKTTKFLAGTAV